MQIKNLVSPHTSLSGHHQTFINNIWQRECGEREPSDTVHGYINWYSHYGEQYGGSL